MVVEKSKSKIHEDKPKEPSIEELKKQNAELHEKYIRLYAEFENYRKRTQKEMADRCSYANEKLIFKLLSIIDDFELALVSCSDEGKKSPLYNGVNMILKNFLFVLEKEGLTQIASSGREFNPQHHEAIGTIQSEEHKKDTVVEMQKGYSYKDKVIRPAKVKVVN
ncbi:MAG: nucleotide exchange factor GrpE [Candidatus Aenigmarchaeota archaeon]|nr:nucleotide exchange factor GrpE [Candidatus Aenigmarchaeota archaeon]